MRRGGPGSSGCGEDLGFMLLRLMMSLKAQNGVRMLCFAKNGKNGASTISVIKPMQLLSVD